MPQRYNQSNLLWHPYFPRWRGFKTTVAVVVAINCHSIVLKNLCYLNFFFIMGMAIVANHIIASDDYNKLLQVWVGATGCNAHSGMSQAQALEMA